MSDRPKKDSKPSKAKEKDADAWPEEDDCYIDKEQKFSLNSVDLPKPNAAKQRSSSISVGGRRIIFCGNAYDGKKLLKLYDARNGPSRLENFGSKQTTIIKKLNELANGVSGKNGAQCDAGKERSALAIFAYLYVKKRKTKVEAFNTVMRAAWDKAGTRRAFINGNGRIIFEKMPKLASGWDNSPILSDGEEGSEQETDNRESKKRKQA